MQLDLDSSKLFELLLAFVTGGALTVGIKALVSRGKLQAEAHRIQAQGNASIVEAALRMTNQVQTSLAALEVKTEELSRKNLKLEHEVSELRVSNINLLREIEAVKRQNDDLERTCGVLLKENTHLRVELENCIKKEP
jgi:chromosome segregation ATPase